MELAAIGRQNVMDFDPEEMRKAIIEGLEVSYYDLCCRKNMHKMYHAMEQPCPCKKVQARVRSERLSILIGNLIARQVDPLPEKEEEKPCV